MMRPTRLVLIILLFIAIFCSFVNASESNWPLVGLAETVQIDTINQPEQALSKTSHSKWVFIILLVLSPSLLVFLSWLIFGRSVTTSSRRKLVESGLLISAQVTKVQVEHHSQDGDSLSYRVFAKWQQPISGKYYQFVSPELAQDPTIYLSNRQIQVFIDEADPKCYFIEPRQLEPKPYL